MQPSVGIDAEGHAIELFQLCGAMYGFEQWQKPFGSGQQTNA